jgi:hypothetical protein
MCVYIYLYIFIARKKISNERLALVYRLRDTAPSAGQQFYLQPN